MTKAATKEPAKGKKQRRTAVEKILDLNSVRVPIDSIQPYPGNPRRGNVLAVAESLRENGQFRSILVQKSTKYIVGGNHTWMGAKKLGWKEISVVFLDVSDTEAARILLADNRTSDLAGYDAEALSDIISAIPEAHVGTGYSSEDIAAITRAADIGMSDLDLDAILRPPAPASVLEDDGKPTRSFGDDDDEEEETEEQREEEAEDLFKNASEFTQGAVGLKVAVQFPSTHPWGIPDLLDTMVVEKLPEPIDTWAGTATKDDSRQEEDPDFHWLYNYGIDSTSGMYDPERILLSFYANDEWFENWWDDPQRMMTKALNAKIKYAITPNYSQWAGEPKVVSLWSLYRSRWVGRYFQDIGIKIIPDVNWRGDIPGWLEDVVLPGIPVGLPWIAMEFQTYEKGETNFIAKDIKKAIKTLKPDNLLLYAGTPGRDFFQTLGLSCNVKWLPNRLIRLGKYRSDLKKDKKGEKPRIK